MTVKHQDQGQPQPQALTPNPEKRGNNYHANTPTPKSLTVTSRVVAASKRGAVLPAMLHHCRQHPEIFQRFVALQDDQVTSSHQCSSHRRRQHHPCMPAGGLRVGRLFPSQVSGHHSRVQGHGFQECCPFGLRQGRFCSSGLGFPGFTRAPFLRFGQRRPLLACTSPYPKSAHHEIASGRGPCLFHGSVAPHPLPPGRRYRFSMRSGTPRCQCSGLIHGVPRQ